MRKSQKRNVNYVPVSWISEAGFAQVGSVDDKGTVQVFVSNKVDTTEQPVKSRLERLVGHFTNTNVLGDVEPELELAVA